MSDVICLMRASVWHRTTRAYVRQLYADICIYDISIYRTEHGASDGQDVELQEAFHIQYITAILIEQRSLPPITLGSGRSGLADTFKLLCWPECF